MADLVRSWTLLQLAKSSEGLRHQTLPIADFGPSGKFRSTAPVSHQKRRERNATKAIGLEQKSPEINGVDQHSAAHVGLVAGSSPAGPTSKSMA
ncbi:hypothetical protein ACVWYH_007705 [Bradyrhizobium sp. GM24.11]